MCVGGGREGGVGMLGIRGIALFLGLLYLGWPGNEGREGDSLLFIRIIIILFIILHNSYSWKQKNPHLRIHLEMELVPTSSKTYYYCVMQYQI